MPIFVSPLRAGLPSDVLTLVIVPVAVPVLVLVVLFALAATDPEPAIASIHSGSATSPTSQANPERRALGAGRLPLSSRPRVGFGVWWGWFGVLGFGWLGRGWGRLLVVTMGVSGTWWAAQAAVAVVG